MSEIDVIEADVVEETEESRAVAVVPVAPTSLAVAPEIGEDDIEPERGKGLRRGKADARSAAGDDGRVAGFEDGMSRRHSEIPSR